MNTTDKLFQRNPRIFRSLQCFEAVARLGSVSAASDEIGITPSAVSHQLRSLADYIGEDLFVRSGRGLALTVCGLELQAQVAAAFNSLASAVRGSIGESKSRLRTAVCTSFGPHWLARRLPDFLAQNPSIQVELRLFSRDPEQTDGVADAMVTADPIAAGFEAVTLFEEMLVAVGRPGTRLDGVPGDLRLITTDLPPANLGEDWREFFAFKGQHDIRPGSGQFVACTHYVLAVALARAGLGAALVPDFVAEDAVKAGDLAILDRARVPARRVYRLCYKQSRSKDPDLLSLTRWLRAACSSMH